MQNFRKEDPGLEIWLDFEKGKLSLNLAVRREVPADHALYKKFDEIRAKLSQAAETAGSVGSPN